MSTPASRILECLEALQGAPMVTGAELAERLQVDPRTVRRYVAALQDLGIPVAAQRGVGGGYRLQPGYRLPPLMLDDDEAAVIVLGLLGAGRGGVDTPEPAVERALDKLRRVLPERLRRQAEALALVAETTRAGSAPEPPTRPLLLLADAVTRGRRVVGRYTRHDGKTTTRTLSPFGLVAHGGRWYLIAHDHDRDAMRTFRIDRLRGLELDRPAISPPPGFDAAEHLRRALRDVPWAWAVDVTVELSHARACALVAPTLARLTPAGPGQTRMRFRVEKLDYAARVLAGLGCRLVLHEPDELRPELERLAERLHAAARAPATLTKA